MDTKKELLILAITEEIKAQRLYCKLHDIIDSEAAKEIFLRLIKIEELHEHKIKKLLSEEFPDHIYKFIPDVEYQAELKQKLNSPEDVYGFAIAKEQKAEAIYTKLAIATDAPDIKDMLLMFAEDEKNHQEILEDEILRLSGILSWFDEDELTGLMEH
jgi:rubrerythrin